MNQNTIPLDKGYKYCKIDKESRATILQMMEQQIQAESITNIILDKEMILGE